MTRGFLNHIWYKLLDEEGIPLPSASVWIYWYRNPVTELNLFDENEDAITQPLTTDANGVLEFYVKDFIKSPTEGYHWDTQYIISWMKDDKSGLIQGDHLWGNFDSANLSGSDGTLNKTISNFLGWTINTHADFKFGSTQRCGSSSSSSSSTSSSSSSLSSSSSSSSLSSSSSSSSYSSCPSGFGPNDDFTGTNGDQPNVDRWRLLESDNPANLPQIQDNKLTWSGYVSGGVGEETHTYISRFKFDSDKTIDFQIDVSWATFTAIGGGSYYGGTMLFGHCRSDGTYLHELFIGRKGGASSITYQHTPGNHSATFPVTASIPPTKIRFRWYGVGDPNESKSTVWIWNPTALRWEWDGNTDGFTTASIGDAGQDHYIKLRYTTDVNVSITESLVSDATFDNFLINEGEVICATSSSSSSQSSSSTSSSSSESIVIGFDTVDKGADLILSNSAFGDNTTVTSDSIPLSASAQSVKTAQSFTGKYYFEVRCDVDSSSSRGGVGIALETFDPTSQAVGSTADSWGWREGFYTHENSFVQFIGSLGAHTANIAVDTINGYFYFGKNGSWYGGNPVSGPAAWNQDTDLIGAIYRIIVSAKVTDQFTIKMKASDMLYSIPSGYSTLL